MDLIFITNDLQKARIAEQVGVQRIMVDLEYLGKQERQKERDTRISVHSIDDVWKVADVLSSAQLMVRVNPMHAGSDLEIEQVLDTRPTIIMVPMLRTQEELMRFVDLVQEKARTCLLLETGQGLARARQLLETPGLSEVHIGLNDLHLELGLAFMFEILAGGLIDHLAGLAHHFGVKLGFGGVAQVQTTSIPVPAEWVLSEHIRVGSSQVILSRDYDRLFDAGVTDEATEKFRNAIERLQSCVETLQRASSERLEATSRALASRVWEIAASQNVIL